MSYHELLPPRELTLDFDAKSGNTVKPANENSANNKDKLNAAQNSAAKSNHRLLCNDTVRAALPFDN
jgi:hypothetical protein